MQTVIRNRIRVTTAGILLSLFAALCMPGTALADFVTVDTVEVSKSRTFYDRRARVYYTQNTISNTDIEPLVGPLRMIVIDSTLPVLNADGTTAAGEPFFTIADTDGFTLAPGASASAIRIDFQRQRVRLSYTLRVEQEEPPDTVPPALIIASPQPLTLLNTATVAVSGTVDDAAAQIVVNGVAAQSAGQSWSATVPVAEGANIITAVATDDAGNSATASVQVTRDTQPPVVTIDSPADGLKTTIGTVAVTGMANDIVPGTVNAGQILVLVNGQSAAVANRSFLLRDLALSPGNNTITAQATDAAGNTASTSINVNFDPNITEPVIELVSGNTQSGPVGSALAAPLVVVLKDGTGAPAAGKMVVYKVTENNGSLAGGGRTNERSVAVTTDAQGQASANWILGDRAGQGNNIVEAAATGFKGTAAFTASAVATAATQININGGNNQVGVAGDPLPQPLGIVLTDDGGNRIQNVPVTFTVVRGNGQFANGLQEFSANSDSDGLAFALLTLGLQEGIENNVIEASFAGNPGVPASFVASGRTTGDPADTTFTGVVHDNTDKPIPGVTITIDGTSLTTQTDQNGQFELQSVPVGNIGLGVDGSTAQLPGTFPGLHFDFVTIAGRENSLGRPIYLLPLDLPNALSVSETTGGTIILPAVPGFKLDVAPGSVTFPGGGKNGIVSVTVVHADKVPMTPPSGQQPRIVVTIQPAGAIFDPPAPLTLPNLDGLAPGQVTNMFSFDHDLGQFVSIGTGTVSENGTVIESDPGVGILKAGWHCGQNPDTQAGSCCQCATCQKCVGNDCAPRVGADKDEVNNITRSFDDLVSMCPQRAQVPASKRLHDVDGCSAPLGFARNNPAASLFSQASTAFGSEQGMVSAGQVNSLPCNRHDLCYQSCKSNKSGCDNAMHTRMDGVCSTAFPSTCPLAFILTGTCPAYFIDRLRCFATSDAFFIGVDRRGSPFYKERQTQYCDCCP